MTPMQKLKHMILNRRAAFGDGHPIDGITVENVDALYAETEEADEDGMQDARNEVRSSGIETGLPAPFSRHYEGDEVATKAPDGSWVGWTHWHGGGKHGEPEAIDWMEDAYDLTCVEEEKMTVVRTFAKVE
jgi:hypothetical protein